MPKKADSGPALSLYRIEKAPLMLLNELKYVLLPLRAQNLPGTVLKPDCLKNSSS